MRPGFERDDDEGVLTGALSRETGEDVDTYAITQGTLAVGDNYTITYTGADFAITPRVLTIKADAEQGKVYGSADPELTYMATGFERDDDEDILGGVLSRASGEDVDTYAVTQGTLSAGANYTIAYTAANFAITPKSLAVTADAGQAKVYGSDDPALSFEATGFERDDDGSVLTGVLSRAPGEDVDSYTITQGTLSAGANYTIAYTGKDFAITAKTLAVTADADQSKVYGSANPVLTYKAIGFERDDDASIFTGALSREAGEDVDSYAITQGTLSAGTNYTIAYTGAGFSITPKVLTIKADTDQGKVYGSVDPVLTFEAAGFERDDDEDILVGILSREVGEDVDTYAITQGTLSAGANYTIAYTGEDFAITAKTLTVTADVGQSKVYGSVDSELTYTATGFERDDDEDILAGALSRETGEDVGSYAITQGTLSAGANYTIAYTGEDFAITAKTLTVTVDADQSKVYGSVDPVLTFEATGFERDDDKNVLTGSLFRALGEDVGTYAIGQGTLAVGSNYTINYIGAGFSITPKPLTVTVDAGQSKMYGSADPVLTYTATGFEQDDDEDVLAGALSREVGEDVDTYAIMKGTLAVGSNYTISYTAADFTITPKTLTVTADAGQGKVYGSDDPALTFDVAGFEREDDEGILGGALSRASGEDVDTYAITQGTLSAGTNYTIAYTGEDFTITPKSLTVTAGAGHSKVYGSADLALTYAATGFERDDDEGVLTGALSRESGEDVDSYRIGQGTLNAGDNYTITYTGADFAITAKTLTVTADAGQGKVYGSVDPMLTFEATGFERDDDEGVLTGVLSRAPGEDVDSYAITQGTLSAGTNYAISYTGANFAITPKELAVTVDAGQAKVYGSADPKLTFDTAGFEWDDDGSVLTGVLSRAPGEDVDSYTITQGTLSAGTNYTIAYTGEDFTITPKSLTVTVDAGQSKVYGSADPVLTYTATGFERDDDEGILGGVLSRGSGEDVDTYAITQGTLSAGTNYAISYTGANFAITPKELAVTVDAGQSKVYGSVDPVLTFEAAGFERDDDGSVLTGALSRESGEDVDTYAITQGTLAIGSNYTISYTAAHLAITPKELAVTADAGQAKVYGSDDPALTFEATGFERDDDESVLTGALSRAPGEEVDSYAIGQGTLSASANYTISYTGANFAITPKALAVKADAGQGKVYGSADPALTFEATGFERDDDESVLTGTLSRAPGEDVDSYAISQGTLAVGSNYTISYTTADFTITPKTLAVKADAGQGKVYGSADPALTFEATGFERDDDEDILAGALSREAGEDVDIYAIMQGTLLAGANYAIAYTGEDFAITAKTLTVTADAGQSKVYGSADPALTFEATGFERDDDESVLTGSLSRAPGEDVDSYAIGQGTLAVGSNYIVSYTAADFTITPKTLTVTAGAGQSKVYGSVDPMLMFEAAGFERDDDEGVLTGVLSRESGEDVDTYAITRGTLDAGDNYTITCTGVDFVITPKTLAVTADAGQSKVYGEDDPVLSYKATGFEFIDNEEILMGALSRVAGEDVDTYAVEIGTLGAGGNYTISYIGTDFSITSKPLTVELSNTREISKVYDGNRSATLAAANHVLEGRVDGDDLSVSSTAVYRDKDAGTDKEIVVSDFVLDGADADNYRIITTSTTTTGVITAKPLTVALDEYPLITKVYDGSVAATLHADNYSLGGIVGEDDVSVKGIATYEDGDAGTEKAITVSGFVLSGADAGNYMVSVTSNSTTGEIVPTRVTAITLKDGSFPYDGAEHALFVTGPLPAGTTVSYSDNRRREAGVQKVTATITGDNYATRVLTAELVIAPATRSINFPVLPAKRYGDADFDAGADASSDEDISYTSSNPSVAEITREGRIRIRGAGETAIVATVPENRNYKNRPEVSRVLRVQKAAQAIAFDAPAEVNREVGSVQLAVSASSGLPVVLTVDDPEVATVSGTALHVLRLGTVRITATQAGDGNHEATGPVTVTVRVTDPASDFPVRVHHAVSPNGDGINEYLIVEAVKDYPENRVRIFNRNGTVVYEASGYNNGTVAFRGTGTGQHQVPAGTYFYTAEIWVNGEWKYEKGWFVLRY